MLQEYNRLIGQCTSLNGVNTIHIAFANTLTPSEVLALPNVLFVDGLHDAPVLNPERTFTDGELKLAARKWAEDLRADLRPVGKDAPEPFRRREIRKNVTLFSDGAAPDNKTLLLAFPGASHRMQMPVGPFLQNLDAASVDVAMVRDGTRRLYLKGIEGVGDSIEEVGDVLPGLLDMSRYRRVCALGASAGGLPLLVIALRLGIENIVVCGAISPFDPRMERSGSLPIAEVLRAANAAGRPKRVVAAFGSHSPKDRQAAEDIAGCVDAQLDEVSSPTYEFKHNVLHPLHREGRLVGYLEEHLWRSASIPQQRAER